MLIKLTLPLLFLFDFNCFYHVLLLILNVMCVIWAFCFRKRVRVILAFYNKSLFYLDCLWDAVSSLSRVCQSTTVAFNDDTSAFFLLVNLSLLPKYYFFFYCTTNIPFSLYIYEQHVICSRHYRTLISSCA